MRSEMQGYWLKLDDDEEDISESNKDRNDKPIRSKTVNLI